LISADLPSADQLASVRLDQSTKIYDRNGGLLFEMFDQNSADAGRRTIVPPERLPLVLKQATIATEDPTFYSNEGVDPYAVLRAIYYDVRYQRTISGGSTITQQLVKKTLLSPEQTITRKIREAILAVEITRRYPKEQILAFYLNTIPYGNLSYGIQAASQSYFKKDVDKLDLAEASLLAGLPQAPALYDPCQDPDAALGRQRVVLDLMQKQSFIDSTQAEAATQEMDQVLHSDDFSKRCTAPTRLGAPHFVTYVRQLLEQQYGTEVVYNGGLQVYTTLDPTMQKIAEEEIAKQVAALKKNNVTDGALVATDPKTGQILAMVGSADFYDKTIDGQVNVATSLRQPGSSIKPINYVAAFEKGWTPATLIWDVPSEFPPSGDPNDTREPYRPVNYDGNFHGPVTVRTALSNSLNIPAVKTLNFVRIYDDPTTPQKDGMIAMAERLGITSFTRPDYGLSLTLGGGDVSLLELTSAYSVFANGGKRVPPVAILKIVDFQGKVVYEYQPPQPEQVIRPEHAFLISSILSDNDARAMMFGRNSLLNLPFQVAAKTGTTNDFRDNWTLGYTPDLVTGVWVGNADYTPMVNTTGLTGAAPIWSAFMQYAVPIVSGGTPTSFAIPPGITEKAICAISGTEPSQWCRGGQRNEFFVSDQPPLPASQDLLRRSDIDTWTGLLAGDACKDFVEDEMVMNVSDKSAREWLRSGAGRDWLEAHDMPRNPFFAPDRECNGSDPHPILEFSNLSNDTVVTDTTLPINGVIDVKNGGFTGWQLEYGSGPNPSDWNVLAQGTSAFPTSSLIYTWNLQGITDTQVTLRLYLSNGEDNYAERKVTITLNLPTPTPVPATPTPFPPTAVPTDTPAPATPTPTPTETVTPFPTETPTTGP
jgi:1A family penicillin-binding protein